MYCSFYSIPYNPSLADAFLDALEKEMDSLSLSASALRTICFGGGTPSILNNIQLKRLCKTVQSRVSIDNVAEWTIEGNPVTFSAEKIETLISAGVTRVSIGAQSFDDQILPAINRRHSVSDISSTVTMLRAAGIDNIGIDLIAALPGVDDTGWKHTLESAVDLAPQHISVYSLSIEPGSGLAARVDSGEYTPPNTDALLDALDTADAFLGRNGYGQYEISNFSTPGNECKHNLAIWRGGDYLGLGPAASSRIGRERWTNKADLFEYIDNQDTIVRDKETLSSEQDVCERVMFAFRLNEGVDLVEFAERFGKPAELLSSHWEKVLLGLADEGVVEVGCGETTEGTEIWRDGDGCGRWKLTAKGRRYADYVASQLLP